MPGVVFMSVLDKSLKYGGKSCASEQRSVESLPLIVSLHRVFLSSDPPLVILFPYLEPLVLILEACAPLAFDIGLSSP